jgi:hypothetical protein
VINIICNIVVLVNLGGPLIESRINAYGHIISENKYNYLVDFSEIAKKHSNWDGDYSQLLVKKEQCIKTKQEKKFSN